MCLICIEKLFYYFNISLKEINQIVIILLIPFLLIWYLMTGFLYLTIIDIEQKQKKYILNDFSYFFFRYFFMLTPILIIILCYFIIQYSYQSTRYNMRIRELVMSKKFIIKENIFLKKKKQIPNHVKNIFLDNLINLKEKCSVCLCEITKGSDLTFCGHAFHNECLNKSLDFNNQCPYCREKIDYQESSSGDDSEESDNDE
jgi:hypothetical protein